MDMVTTSYHMQTSVSVGRGIVSSISVHKSHKGEVYFIQMTCVLRSIYDELYPMDKNNFNNFLIRGWQWIIHVKKAYSYQYLYFVYVVEAIITLNWKS